MATVTRFQPEIEEDVSELLESLLEMPGNTIYTWMMNIDIAMFGKCGVFISEKHHEGEVDVIRIPSDAMSRTTFTFMFTVEGDSYKLTRGRVYSSCSGANFYIGQSPNMAKIFFKTRVS